MLASTRIEYQPMREILSREVEGPGPCAPGADCLLFGVSDKPDEASVPGPEQAREGNQPLHRLETLAAGEV